MLIFFYFLCHWQDAELNWRLADKLEKIISNPSNSTANTLSNRE